MVCSIGWHLSKQPTGHREGADAPECGPQCAKDPSGPTMPFIKSRDWRQCPLGLLKCRGISQMLAKTLSDIREKWVLSSCLGCVLHTSPFCLTFLLLPLAMESWCLSKTSEVDPPGCWQIWGDVCHLFSLDGGAELLWILGYVFLNQSCYITFWHSPGHGRKIGPILLSKGELSTPSGHSQFWTRRQFVFCWCKEPKQGFLESLFRACFKSDC